MSKQFPISNQSEDSREAFNRLVLVLGGLDGRDDKVLSWIVDWAYDACKGAIVKAEAELMRQEHFGYAEDAERTMEDLRSYGQAMTVIVALKDYVGHLIAEHFGQRMGGYFKDKYGKPDVPTTGKEVKPNKGKSQGMR